MQSSTAKQKCRSKIVNASRIPPRPSAGHEARGCRAAAGGLEGSSVELLEAAWELQNLFWRALGGVLEASWRLPELSWRLLERLGRALGAPGADLEASWEVLGRSWRRLRGVLEAPWAVLEPSWELWRPCWSHLEAKRFPK